MKLRYVMQRYSNPEPLISWKNTQRFSQTDRLVFLYELSAGGFESCCSHLILRYRACLEQWVPLHSGNVCFFLFSYNNLQSMLLHFRTYTFTKTYQQLVSLYLEMLWDNNLAEKVSDKRSPIRQSWIVKILFISMKKRKLSRYLKYI